ncbi:hypothetical protein EMIHUDRAFT_212380 [Emiliania huxleyi CCMP1516]|uniref:Uncharacterized protein n=2 Tax=Emiliania huxleyi TaxID=2903 RepID=A0A0D3IRG9_EMIH1|nr:hypothetical protein EMIHUDRAFT_212380 [Emiliania huxleyi CCMP1516]EOD13854.1 hypothetical protein EMIHUDRAFT_212380 [Emiliania huxleyi CCMP1516]|eukprot:XP_005766283.1 hypothetical protein EMIHUDRAFT_212380 [Emiliania huxleyi CCMP1516]
MPERGRLRAHSEVSLSALNALESRSALTQPRTIELDAPPPPPPRRRRVRAGSTREPARCSRQRSVEASIVLDGFLLLEAARVEDPEEAERIVLEGCGLSRVVAEDLAFFTRLTHLDLGDNGVELEDLASLPALEELHIDCNGLTRLHVPENSFARLEILNVSFNGIAPDTIVSLGSLPMLKELDLSNNRLAELPASLASLTSLRQLACDNNRLSSESVIHSLATLPKLCSLSLARNAIERLPASVEEGGFAMLASLSLAHNCIEHESDVAPLLQRLSSLSRLLLYGNPFVSRTESGGLSLTNPQARAQSSGLDGDADEEESSFFLTGAGAAERRGELTQDEALEQLALELSSIPVDHSRDTPSAVAALRAALRRVDDAPPLLSDASFLQQTASTRAKARPRGGRRGGACTAPAPEDQPPPPLYTGGADALDLGPMTLVRAGR